MARLGGPRYANLGDSAPRNIVISEPHIPTIVVVFVAFLPACVDTLSDRYNTNRPPTQASRKVGHPDAQQEENSP